MTAPFFTVDAFAGREGESFVITARPPVPGSSASSEGCIALRLAEVTPWGATGDTHGGRCFTLVFRGPVTPQLGQGIHAFEHETIGVFEIFIVPLGPDEAGPRYEAVFS